MGNRPIEILLFCDLEDAPLAKAVADQLSANGIVSSYGHNLNDAVLRQCQSVAVCIGENTDLLESEVCAGLLRAQLASEVFRVVIVFLPNACREDYAGLPARWIEFKSENDPVALRELIAIIRASLHVFLCHSKIDKPAVRKLYKFLRANGFRPWLDEKDIGPGRDWDLTIQEAIAASQAVIVCLSHEAVTKPGFRHKEIRLALDVADRQPEGSVFIIVARLEKCDVPNRLRKWQWVDLWKPGEYQKLLRTLQLKAKHLGPLIDGGLTSAEVTNLKAFRRRTSGTILVVEANADMLSFLTQVLTRKGWRVLTAETAEQAFKAMPAKEDAPKITLIDNILPDTSGLTFGIRLREQAPTMGIIIMSVDEPTPEELVTCRENGIDSFMIKPFLAAQLLGELRRIRRRQTP